MAKCEDRCAYWIDKVKTCYLIHPPYEYGKGFIAEGYHNEYCRGYKEKSIEIKILKDQ